MDLLQIFTFGGLQLKTGETPVTGFETRKAEALLVYLACTRREHSREVLADMFWDERTQRQALANLRVVLTSLRKHLGPYLKITHDTVALNTDAPVWVDAGEFEACLQGKPTSVNGKANRTIEDAGEIEQVLRLYEGEFLQGFYVRESQGFATWLAQEREHLHQLATGSMHGLVEFYLRSGAIQAGIDTSIRLLVLDPLSEPAHQQMMRLLAYSGRRSEALAHFELCRQKLWDELGVEPAAETLALVDRIRSGEIGQDAVEHQPASKPAIPLANPYKGLRAFQEFDAGDFFGREALTTRLVARMCEQEDAARFLAVVGPSGSGKSSLVKAGLIPALRGGALPGSERWPIIEMVPTSHPFEELEISLLRVAADPKVSMMEQLKRDRRGLLRAARLVLAADDQELLLVIDQFEELFTLVNDPADTQRFLECLYTAVTDPRSRVRVVITLRADFFDRPLLNRDLSGLMQNRTEVMVPLNTAEMERAIRAPVERGNITVEPALVTAIVADMVEQPAALPLLQYALTELFERSSGSRLTLAAYQVIGGVKGVLDRRAEDVFAGLSEAGKAAARQVFLRLVTGEGSDGLSTPDTRRRVLRAELESVAPTAGQPADEWAGAVVSVIDMFGEARLLSFDRDAAARSPTVEISHEALLSEWRRLRGWLEEGREDIHMQRALGNICAEWIKAGRDRGFLLNGARLSLFERWSAETNLALTEEEHAFLSASLVQRKAQELAEEVRQERERRLERRARLVLRALVVVLLLATLGALALSWVARGQARLATAREQAVMAISSLESDPERSILLSLISLRTDFTRDGENALHRAVQSSRVRMVLPGHRDGVRSVDFSPNGKTVATSSYTGDVTVWDISSGMKRLSLPGTLARYSPDGTRLATSGKNGDITIWGLAAGEKTQVLPGGGSEVMAINFNPAGTLLAATEKNTSLKVWDVKTGREVFYTKASDTGQEMFFNAFFSPDGRVLVSVDAQVFGEIDINFWNTSDWELIRRVHRNQYLQFSPDGRWLVGAKKNQSIENGFELWDLQSEELAALDLGVQARFSIPTAHNTVIDVFAFSQDGVWLATASQDGIVKVWQLASEGPVQRLILSGHRNISAVAFSSDNTRLASASLDGDVRIWDLTPAGGSEWFAFEGHSNDIYRAVLTRDERYMATGSVDGVARVWDLASKKEVITIDGHGSALFGVAISPDGTYLATAGFDNKAKLWKLDLSPENPGAELAHTLDGHTSGPPIGDLFPGLTSVVFSPDGKLVVTGGVDGLAKIWDVETGQLIQLLQPHPDRVGICRLAFSPDGRMLAASTDGPDAVIKIWDAASWKEISTYTGHSDSEYIWAMAFSRDGRRAASGASLGIVKIWDTATGQELGELAGHNTTIVGVAFTPDGESIISSSPDGTARVWHLKTGEEELLFTSPGGPFFDVTLTSDGKRLIVPGAGVVYGYYLDRQDLVQLAYSRLTRWLLPEECRQYLHQETCPER